MGFWSHSKKGRGPADAGRVHKSRKAVRRAAPVAMEVKLLALEAGLSPDEVGELAGAIPETIQKWQSAYSEGGIEVHD